MTLTFRPSGGVSPQRTPYVYRYPTSECRFRFTTLVVKNNGCKCFTIVAVGRRGPELRCTGCGPGALFRRWRNAKIVGDNRDDQFAAARLGGASGLCIAGVRGQERGAVDVNRARDRVESCVCLGIQFQVRLFNNSKHRDHLRDFEIFPKMRRRDFGRVFFVS